MSTTRGERAVDGQERLDRKVSVSVVIAAWNSWHDLEPCLRSIFDDVGGSSRYEVIVVDNQSQDGTPEKLARAFPQVRQIRNARNEGHTRAVNQGIAHANGETILLLDADTVVRPGVVDRLERFLNDHPDTFIVAPRMFNGDGSLQETARDFPRPINGLFGRQSVLTRWFPDNRFAKRYLRTEDRDRKEPFEVEWVSAACMMFPRRLADVIGPWDEGFHSYWVDADWCKRAGEAGGRIFCDPGSEVIHYEQNRRGKRKSPARIMMFHRSVLRFYRKHYSFGYWDPRAIVAAIALGLRAGLLVLGNVFLAPDEAHAPPLRAGEHSTRRAS